MTVVGVDGAGAAPPKAGDAARGAGRRRPTGDQQSALKQQALADTGVQAMLDVFRRRSRTWKRCRRSILRSRPINLPLT